MTGKDILVSEDLLARCAEEPIHIPGAIQPHGVLIAFSEPTLTISQISANAAQLLDCDPQSLLGKSLVGLLETAQTDQLKLALSQPALQEVNPLRLRFGDRDVDGIVHRQNGVTILELEPRTTTDISAEQLLGRTLRRLQASSDLGELQSIAVEEIRVLTGYDRVMLYQFDADGHGSVIAESKADEVSSYLGLHYPASDIPAQARELYRLNWLRIIPDASYTPATLIPELRPDTGKPLDLSFAVLRSVSPVHREYLRNFGAQASMSISLLKQDTLWGLITCVNRQPRFVPYELRTACVTIGQLLSLQISAFEELDQRQRWESRRPLLLQLNASMRASNQEPTSDLAEHPQALLELVEATGAAIVEDEQIITIGTCPPADKLSALADWLRVQAHDGLLHTHKLPRDFPAAAAYKEQASGLLAIVLPKPERSMVLWFRPEVIQTVNWSGNPDEAGALEPDTLRLHPRHSFELWKEQVRDQAERWHLVDIQVASDLRRSLIEADLARQVASEQMAVQARDDMIAVVSHDLRNPMAVVMMQAALLKRSLVKSKSEPSRRLLAVAERIHQAAGRMTTLLHDLVDLSKIEAGRFLVDPHPENPTELLDEAVDLLQPVAQNKSILLSWSSNTTAPVAADPERVFQVFSNLIGNAIKFTPEHGKVVLAATQAGDWIEFTVSDAGPGIPLDQQPHLFDRYWQARHSHNKGTGLGLYIARGIVEAHGGRTWVESRPGEGSTFHFTLPLASPPTGHSQAHSPD